MHALADLARRLENLIRLGTVAAVDHGSARCRVQSGGILTAWLPWVERRAGLTRHWTPPTVGEQVIVFSPSGEPAAGVVLTGLYTDTHDQPSSSADDHVVSYPDGARVSYNHATGHLEAVGVQTATVEAAVLVTIDAPDTVITGRLRVEGHLTYQSGMTGYAGAGGGASATLTGQFVHTGGSLSSNGIVLHTHTHSGVQPGGGSTGGPQ